MYKCYVTKVVEPVKYKVEIGESYFMLSTDELLMLRDEINEVLNNNV